MWRLSGYQEHQSSKKPTRTTTTSQTHFFKSVEGALASNCKPVRPGTVSLSKESVKGVVSSHILEFRTTEIKENQRKKSNNYPAIYLTEQKKHWTREALSKISAQRRIEKVILQAQNEPTPKWLETHQITLKNKPNQAHKYAKSGWKICQIRLTNTTTICEIRHKICHIRHTT